MNKPMIELGEVTPSIVLRQSVLRSSPVFSPSYRLNGSDRSRWRQRTEVKGARQKEEGAGREGKAGGGTYYILAVRTHHRLSRDNGWPKALLAIKSCWLLFSRTTKTKSPLKLPTDPSHYSHCTNCYSGCCFCCSHRRRRRSGAQAVACLGRHRGRQRETDQSSGSRAAEDTTGRPRRGESRFLIFSARR